MNWAWIKFSLQFGFILVASSPKWQCHGAFSRLFHSFTVVVNHGVLPFSNWILDSSPFHSFTVVVNHGVLLSVT
jgi:hypothetical protein